MIALVYFVQSPELPSANRPWMIADYIAAVTLITRNPTLMPSSSSPEGEALLLRMTDPGNLKVYSDPTRSLRSRAFDSLSLALAGNEIMGVSQRNLHRGDPLPQDAIRIMNFELRALSVCLELGDQLKPELGTTTDDETYQTRLEQLRILYGKALKAVSAMLWENKPLGNEGSRWVLDTLADSLPTGARALGSETKKMLLERFAVASNLDRPLSDQNKLKQVMAALEH